MPKATFHNLPGDKRQRIVELAIDEFSERSFHHASLSRIVARAGIAKGSIYQYFDGKLDLYRWLLTEEVPRRKITRLQARTAGRPPASLRELLRGAVLSGIELVLADPRMAQIAAGVTVPTDNPELRALHAEVLANGHAQFTEMLRPMREQGEIRDDVDLDLVARVLSAVLGQGLRLIVLARLGVDMLHLMRDPDRASELRDDELEQLVDGLLTVLLEGVSPRG